MPHNQSVVIRPARSVSGSVRLPGDKSISHRYAMLGGIAEGTTKLENFSTGADCASTLACMRSLGVEGERDKGAVTIHGRGAKLQAPTAPLDCGNSGSTVRMLSGILAGQEFASDLTGDESLSRRPMARIIAPLEMMGAKIQSSEGGRLPLRLTGGRLKAIDYKLPVASAQVKTSLLFAGLYADGETRIEEPMQTRDHGELALQAFGAQVDRRMKEVSIQGGQSLHAIEALVPGDISSAAFFLCAAGLFPDSRLTLPGLLMNPSRARLFDVLIGLGMKITLGDLQEQHGELIGTAQVQGGTLKGARITGGDTAALIDEIPVLAVLHRRTGDPAYARAVSRAADYILRTFVEPVAYVGGLNDTTHVKSVKTDSVGVMFLMRSLLFAGRERGHTEPFDHPWHARSRCLDEGRAGLN
jgi:3-phosphoshikimate 1-carboxyvinyltransferase